MKHENSLIIFAKNSIPGKVKTRLAATIGTAKALNIYKQLIEHTYSVTTDIICNKTVYYSDYIETNDVWKNGYKKAIQTGNVLGERMKNAFEDIFKMGCKKAVIVGTDCPALTSTIISDAFTKLEQYEVVIGPASDGGYYLLGMKKPHQSLFSNIEWSTSTVFDATIAACDQLQLQYDCLTVLHDVDEEKDLQYFAFKNDG